MSETLQRITIELNPRERRLYDALRARVVETPPGAASGLRDMLLLLPDLTVMLGRLLRDDRVPRGGKLVALLGLGYVLSPIDLVPSVLFGPLGLADDLLVVAATLSRLVNHVHPDVVRDAWPGKGDALATIQSVTGWAEGVFGKRLRGALRSLLRVDPGAAR
jgi:uncharacterized membrane protein YkvA (DUF1232 family)